MIAPLALLAAALAMIPPYQVDSVRFRFTHYDQDGRGYQSRAGPAGQPGSERLIVEQPQAEVVARIGDRITSGSGSRSTSSPPPPRTTPDTTSRSMHRTP